MTDTIGVHKKKCHLFHSDISPDNVGIIFCASSTIKILAKTGKSGNPMAMPSACTYVLLSRLKWTFFVERYDKFFISCVVMLVLISFLLYIILIIILIVTSKWTLVNSDTTSNDTIWYPGGIFCIFSVFINDLLLLVVYCDFSSGFNIWAKFFASTNVAVLIFEIICFSGKSSTVPSSLFLCNLAVP